MRKPNPDRLQEQSSKASFTRYYQKSPTANNQPGQSVGIKKGRALTRVLLLFACLVLFVLLARGLLITDYNLKLLNDFDPYGQATAYQSKLDDLTKSPVFIFKPLLNQNELGRDIKQSFSEIESVHISTSWLSTKASVKAAVAKPVFIVKNLNGVYLLDAQGRLINRYSELTQDTKQALLTIEDQTGFNPSQNNQVLSSAEVASIQQINEHLKSNGVGVESIVLPPLPSELHVKTNQGYFIKFLLRGNIRLQIGAYLAVKQNIADGKIPPPTEYIDVRVEDKVFVK